MIIGTLEIHLRLEGCYSLKDKRRILRSAIDRSRRDFRVSISEVADHDLWNVATVGVACVGNDAGVIESILTKVVDLFDTNPEVKVEAANREIEGR